MSELLGGFREFAEEYRNFFDAHDQLSGYGVYDVIDEDELAETAAAEKYLELLEETE